MDLMMVVSAAQSARYVRPLARACARRGIEWGCFFTNDGVTVLEEPDVVAALADAAQVFVCEASWQRYGGERACPMALGSQTQHSAMIADAARVVSL